MLRLFKKSKDLGDLSDRDLDKVFERFLTENKISLKFCSSHYDCQVAIFKIAQKIQWFQQEYNYVPNKAYLVLSNLSSTERKMIGQL